MALERISGRQDIDLIHHSDKGLQYASHDYISSIEEVQEAVKKAVDFYNHERPHMSIDMLVPSEASAYKGDIPKRWNSRREQAIRSRLDIPENSLPLPVESGSKVSVNFFQG